MKIKYKDIKKIASAAKKSGGRALIVGGYVRDEIMGLKSKDYDLEVYGTSARKLEKILKDLNLGDLNTVGRQFGVFKLGDNVDISIPRRDSKILPGHKGFKIKGDPDMTIEEAAKRRDLTINSMAKDPLTGEVFDPFNGKEDIKRGVLRATDPDSFVEDPLRVLRIMQFAGRFGFRVDPKTRKLCLSIKEKLKELPQARITDEWKKLLLKSEKPSVGLRAAKDLGIFDVLHPEIHSIVGFEQEKEWHPEGDVFEHTCRAVDQAARTCKQKRLSETRRLVIVLGTLCHDFGKPATTEFKDGRLRSHGHDKAGEEPTRRFLSRLDFGKEITERVIPLILEHHLPKRLYDQRESGKQVSDRAIRRLATRLKISSINDLVLVCEADHRGRGFLESELDLSKRIRANRWLTMQAKRLRVKEERPQQILMGRHLIRYLHWDPGPNFGKVLRGVYEAQLDGEVKTLYQAFNSAKQIKRTLSYLPSWGGRGVPETA